MKNYWASIKNVNFLSLCLFLLLLICPERSSFGGANDFVLVVDHAPAGTVLGPTGDTQLEQLAYDDFLEYIEKSTGASLAAGESAKTVILRVVGQPIPGNPAVPQLKRHGFWYRVTPQQLMIIGQDPGGLSYGVHWFLRKYLGVRWYMPGALGEEVPDLADFSVAAEEIVKTPEFEWVRMAGGTGEEGIWANRHREDKWDPEYRDNWWRSHNWNKVCGSCGNGEFCLTDPAYAQIFAQDAIDYFDGDSSREMYSIEPDDNRNESPSSCTQDYELEDLYGSWSEVMLHFMNDVAEIVYQTYPDKILGFYAYGGHHDAPNTITPHPMLSPMAARHGGRACYRHSLLDPRNSINQKWVENFERWMSNTSYRGYYAYWAYYSWFLPLPLKRLEADLAYLKSWQVYQLNSENTFSWATNAPYYWLAYRLIEDTTLKADDLMQEFCRNVYGPAYSPMLRYWNRWYEAWNAAPQRDSDGYHWEDTYSAALIAAAYEDIRQAKQLVAAADERYRERVELADIGLRYTDYYLAMLRGENKDMMAAKIKALLEESLDYPEPVPFQTSGSFTGLNRLEKHAGKAGVDYDDLPTPVYTLTVSSGSGDGEYEDGTVVSIAADAPPAGKVFYMWQGDTKRVADVNDATTTVSMKVMDGYLTAAYKSINPGEYSLTVNSGSGDGVYQEDTVVVIVANDPPAGQVFDKWTGDTAGVAGVNDATTALTMPAAHTVVTATYRAGGSDPDPTAEGNFQQDGGSEGLVCMEAEHYDAKADRGGHQWTLISDANAAGGQAMQAMPNDDTNVDTGYGANSPRLDFSVNFVKTGTHYIWVRGFGATGSENSCHAGLDGNETSSSDRMGDFTPGSWTWLKDTRDAGVATINVTSTGAHTVNIWMREDGFKIDKLVLTTSAAYTPGSEGPAESRQSDAGDGGNNPDTTAPAAPAGMRMASP